MYTEGTRVSNSFGPSASQQYPLVDPRCVRQHRDRFRRDQFSELDLANSYYALSGGWPDVGWILLDRDSYNKFDPYATSFELHVQDFANPELVITNLCIVQARCVTRGLATDAGAIYLIQVTNTTGTLYNPWFQFPVNKQYNVRAPAYPSTFHTWSMNAGTTWTWDAMVGDLWATAPTQLGNYPHLPTVPAGTPEGWVFVGVPLWTSVTRVLDHLGMTVVGDYPALAIAVDGADDAVFTALQSKYSTCLEDDMEFLDGGSGRVPSQVVVYFHRRNTVYGTEETIRYDSYNWQATPAYSVTVAAPASFSRATGTAYLWADFTVRHDQNGDPLPADIVVASGIARDRATQFFAKIFSGTRGFLRQVYGGVVPFTTGSQVDGVRWSNTGLLGARAEWAGWRTEIVRGYLWEETMFSRTLQEAP